MFYIELRTFIGNHPGIDGGQLIKEFCDRDPQELSRNLRILIDNNFVEVRSIEGSAKFYLLAKPFNPGISRELCHGDTPRWQDSRERKYQPKKDKIEVPARFKKPFVSLVDRVFEEIKSQPGISTQDLVLKKLSTQGRVDTAAKRLAFAGLIKIEMHPNRQTRNLDRVYFPA